MRSTERMPKQSAGGFSAILGGFVRASSALAAFVAFAVVIPFTLWFAWTRRSGGSLAIIETLFCAAFGWMMIAILGWFRRFRGLGQSSSKLLLGPRPDDADELLAWKWGRHFRYSLLAVLISMGAFALVLWLKGE
jgi:hypothetical protein